MIMRLKAMGTEKALVAFFCMLRETLVKAFLSPDLHCKAAFSLANPCDPPEVAKQLTTTLQF
jgi:hypothetical protein